MVVNKDYQTQLWIGWIDGGGFNYEIKGFDDNDYRGKAEICDKFIQNLKDIRDYYSRLVID